MDLIVAAKYVPDIQKVPEEAWDRERGTLKRQLLQMTFNPLDRVALRTALRLRDLLCGAGAPACEDVPCGAGAPACEDMPGRPRVTVLTMGPPVAARLLREAIAHGADAGVLLTDRAFAGSDTLATAYALQRTIRHLIETERVSREFVLICGMQSPDGDTAQVPAQIASLLDCPIYPYVVDVVRSDDGAARYRCLNPVGFQVVTPRRLPYVITTTRLAEDLPFYASLDGILRAEEAEILTLDAAAIRADRERIGLEGSRTRVVRIYATPRKAAQSEPLMAEHPDFAQHARHLWRRLGEAFAERAQPPAADAEESTTTETAPYYQGDCLAVCEVQEGRLTTVSFEVVSRCAHLARQLGVACGAVLYGAADQQMAEALRLVGAETLYVIDEPVARVSPHKRDPVPFRVREQALALAAFLEEHRPQVVILPATLTGRVVAPYMAARLDCGLTADCSALDVADFAATDRASGERVTYGKVLQQTRPALGGNIMARIVSIYRDQSVHRPQMATARPGALECVETPAEHCEIIRWQRGSVLEGARNLSLKVPDTLWTESLTEHISLEPRPEAKEEIDLNDFEAIVSVGMGVRDLETIERLVLPFIERLAEFLGCEVGLGCSRAVVDAGILPHVHQVGQTGIVVKPKLYLALGVSGAIQHRIGMEGARLILCLNRDPDAPMHALADFSIIGDIEQTLPVLQEALADA